MLFEPEFWVAVGFFLFIALLVYLGVPRRMLDTLDKRSARIKTELDEARRLREEAAQLLAEYQRRRHQADEEAQAILESARAEAERVAAEARTRMEEFIARRTNLAQT